MNEKIKKANNIMGLIRRSFAHLDEAMFLKLHQALVHPHIEYGNTLGYPCKIKDLTAIENVQRRGTRYLPGLKGMPYEERLKTLKLPTLQYRRLRGDMIQTYKLMPGKCDKMVTNFIPKNGVSTTSLPTIGHSLKLYIQRAEKTLHQNFFSIRVASHWNNLPESVTEAPTAKALEKHLDKYWKEHELIYNYRAETHYSPIANRMQELEKSTTEGAVDKLEI